MDIACKSTTKVCFIALLNGHPTLRPVGHYDDDEEYDLENFNEETGTKLEHQVKILQDVKNKL